MSTSQYCGSTVKTLAVSLNTQRCQIESVKESQKIACEGDMTMCSIRCVGVFRQSVDQ